MYAATYVRDIDTSRAFYELLGFRELRAGRAATSAWSALQHHTLYVLLASTRPPLEIPPLPLLFYFFYDDVEAVLGMLTAAGVRTVRTGRPRHALGGEVKVLDPDGNTILLGTREPAAAQASAEQDEPAIRFSLLKEAAALAAGRGETSRPCRVRGLDGRPCPDPAEVKLADSLGDTAWTCLAHADEILVAAPEVFIASHQGRGLAAFLSHRREPS